MKLRSLLFGPRRRYEYLPAMNRPSRPQGGGQGGTAMPPIGNTQTPPCNPPSREPTDNPNEICTPYGKLLPDAESYMRNIADRGNEPYLFSMKDKALSANAYIEALWTGEHMQVTAMLIPAGAGTSTEMHEKSDQLITVMDGRCLLQIGRSEMRLSPLGELRPGDSAIIPAGYWHSLTSRGSTPLRIISVYSPAHHPYGTRKENLTKS